MTLNDVNKLYSRIVLYPLASLIFGLLFFIVFTFAFLKPLGLTKNVNLFEQYIIETILIGWVVVIAGEWKRGWKTKVFLMGTTSLLSILIWIVVAKFILPY